MSALTLEAGAAPAPPGQYIYATHRWTFTGLRRESRLVSAAVNLNTGGFFEPEVTERLVATAAQLAAEFPNAARRLQLARVVERGEECEAALLSGYSDAAEQFRAENEMRCNVQAESARAFHARRASELRARIERFRQEGKLSLIPPTEGLLRKLDQELDLKLRKVEVSRQIEESFVPLAVGYVEVVIERR